MAGPGPLARPSSRSSASATSDAHLNPTATAGIQNLHNRVRPPLLATPPIYEPADEPILNAGTQETSGIVGFCVGPQAVQERRIGRLRGEALRGERPFQVAVSPREAVVGPTQRGFRVDVEMPRKIDH